MSPENTPNPAAQKNPNNQKVKESANQAALALELPFSFVAAVAIGGLIGYFLDGWLHTSPWLMIVLGCLGFAGGILEIARRFGPKDSGGRDSDNSS